VYTWVFLREVMYISGRVKVQVCTTMQEIARVCRYCILFYVFLCGPFSQVWEPL
jgi:hypothetical protein